MADWLDDDRLYRDCDGAEERNARRAVLERLAAAGLAREELERAVEDRSLTTLPAQVALAGETPYTLTDVARLAGLDTKFLRQLLLGLGRPNPKRGERAFTDGDLEEAKTLRAFVDAGLPRQGILEVSRVLGHGMANTAAAIRELVTEAFEQRAASEHELAFRYAEVAEELAPMLGPLLEHELLVHIREGIRREAVAQAERDAEAIPGTHYVAIGFADLVDFTKLGGELPPDQLGRIAGRLAELAMREARAPVQLVKTIGDAVMFGSSEVGPLLDALRALFRAAADDHDFPGMRAGVAYGRALTRGGDWFGAPVNLASRLTTSAKPGTIHVAEDARTQVESPYEWGRKRKKSLKGVGRVGYFRLAAAR